MKRFFGWVFIFFAVTSFFGGFVDPEVGIGGGIFASIFWGLIGYFLLKKGKKKAKTTTLTNSKSVKPANVDSASEDLLKELEDLEELEDVTELITPVQTVRFACNSCGAKNEVKSSGNEIRCEYCDSPSIPASPSV